MALAATGWIRLSIVHCAAWVFIRSAAECEDATCDGRDESVLMQRAKNLQQLLGPAPNYSYFCKANLTMQSYSQSCDECVTVPACCDANLAAKSGLGNELRCAERSDGLVDFHNCVKSIYPKSCPPVHQYFCQRASEESSYYSECDVCVSEPLCCETLGAAAGSARGFECAKGSDAVVDSGLCANMTYPGACPQSAEMLGGRVMRRTQQVTGLSFAVRAQEGEDQGDELDSLKISAEPGRQDRRAGQRPEASQVRDTDRPLQLSSSSEEAPGVKPWYVAAGIAWASLATDAGQHRPLQLSGSSEVAPAANLWYVAAGIVWTCFAAGLVALTLGYWICSPLCCGDGEDVEVHRHLQQIGCMIEMSVNIWFTFAIPDSLNEAESIGQNAVFSGVDIGILKSAASVACLLLWLVHRLRPEVLEEHVRYPLLFFISTPLAGFGVTLCAQLIGAESATTSAGLLLIGRCLLGISSGAAFPTEKLCAKMCTPDQLAAYSMERIALATLGLGLGPLLNACSRMLFTAISGSSDDPLIRQVGTCSCLAYALTMFVILFSKLRFLVDMESALDVPEEVLARQMTPKAASMSNYIVVFSCIIFVTTRAFVVAGLEAATAMILEEVYSWPLDRVGIVVGMTLLVADPWRHVISIWREVLSNKGWIRMLTVINIVGSFLLFPSFTGVLGLRNEAGLVVASMVVYPACMLVSGFVKAVMLTVAVPDTVISQANVLLSYSVIVDLIGRGVGPALGRAAARHGGQQAYAVQQAALLMAASLVCEVGIVQHAA